MQVVFAMPKCQYEWMYKPYSLTKEDIELLNKLIYGEKESEKVYLSQPLN